MSEDLIAIPHSGVKPEETGWLIEMAGMEDAPVSRWWHPQHGWVWDSSKALRFAREEDANDFSRSRLHGAGGKATEHRWLTAPQSPPVVSEDMQEVTQGEHWSRQEIVKTVINAITAAKTDKSLAVPAGEAADAILAYLAPALDRLASLTNAEAEIARLTERAEYDREQTLSEAATKAEEIYIGEVAANRALRDEIARLREALVEARTALHQHYVDWDGEPEDAVPLQLARAKCDAALGDQP